ncbi:hypothetical protein IW262DRAFT_1298790 [Armillaria fumosa]|nr:hypothetical protein IW262DRAFT_1298790 [Armillaria fumosa]
MQLSKNVGEEEMFQSLYLLALKTSLVRTFLIFFEFDISTVILHSRVLERVLSHWRSWWETDVAVILTAIVHVLVLNIASALGRKTTITHVARSAVKTNTDVVELQIRIPKDDACCSDKPKKMLSWLCWPIEFLSPKHRRYTDKGSTTQVPHLGRGCPIAPSQLIHATLAFKQDYAPSAVLFGDIIAWRPLLGIGNVEDLCWADEWEHFPEMDLLEHSVAQVAMRELQSLRSNDVDKRDVIQQVALLKRLSFMALFRKGSHKISEIIKDFVDMLSDEEDRITAGSASCLFQLAKHGFLLVQRVIGHHRQILEDLDVVLRRKSMLHDSVRDDFLKNKTPSTSSEETSHPSACGVGTWKHVDMYTSYSLIIQGVVLDVISLDRSKMLRRLMRMIKSKNSKSKRVGVHTKDGVMRKLVLQREDLLVDLMTSLFRERNHCHHNDKDAVVKAFEAIATHSEIFAQLKQKRVIQVLVHILCVGRWLNVEESITLLKNLNSNGSLVEMINGIIKALVPIDTNGDNLYKTQSFFHAIYGPGKILEANPGLAPDASVMKTIVKAMMYPHSHPKAVKFLKSIAMRTEIYPIMQKIHLFEKIIKLGGGDDDDALFSVRTALEDFIQPDSPFVDLLLKPNVFAILTKNIDWDVAHTFCKRHNLRQSVKAQESGVRCIQKLIAIAFKDEPESAEGLRLYCSSGYDRLLLETLSKLVTFEDSRRRIHGNMNLREKLQRFITVPEPGSSSLDASRSAH